MHTNREPCSAHEVRKYLLEKWQRRCAYGDAEDIGLEIEHVIAPSPGGSNLTLSCCDCNKRKGKSAVPEFLTDRPEIPRKILSDCR